MVLFQCTFGALYEMTEYLPISISLIVVYALIANKKSCHTWQLCKAYVSLASCTEQSYFINNDLTLFIGNDENTAFVPIKT